MDSSAIFGLYQEIAPAEAFRVLQRQMGVIARNGIFTARVVIWMMIHERLEARGTLERSVAQLVQGRFDPILSQCKRVREKRISLATGGYCQARQNLPRCLVDSSMDELIERLRSRLLDPNTTLAQRVYLLDGSSIQLEHEPELVEAYPPGSNQHGKAHWPLIRVVVLHDLETGLAERPYWGPMNGSHAVSEQALADLAMQHVPAGSVLIGDRNFGIFSTVYRAHKQGLGVIVRLTAARAQSKSLMGRPIARICDTPICWRASRWDGKKNRDWPDDACVQGRLIACRVGRGKRKQWLYLFTTLTLPVEEIARLYGLRWNIETDLRSLKQTIRLGRITAQSLDMMEKELLLAVMAYNLVRAIMFLGAQRAKTGVRQLSFTYACNIVLNGCPKILAARGAKRQQEELDRVIDLVAKCKLPKRTKRRSYPRTVWGSGYHFPTRPREKN
jgi:hypothetical protein